MHPQCTQRAGPPPPRLPPHLSATTTPLRGVSPLACSTVTTRWRRLWSCACRASTSVATLLGLTAQPAPAGRDRRCEVGHGQTGPTERRDVQTGSRAGLGAVRRRSPGVCVGGRAHGPAAGQRPGPGPQEYVWGEIHGPAAGRRPGPGPGHTAHAQLVVHSKQADPGAHDAGSRGPLHRLGLDLIALQGRPRAHHLQSARRGGVGWGGGVSGWVGSCRGGAEGDRDAEGRLLCRLRAGYRLGCSRASCPELNAALRPWATTARPSRPPLPARAAARPGSPVAAPAPAPARAA